MSFKPLFARALGAAPDRLHLAAHSHHLWPDASFAGQVACWEDAARLADSKWDKVMGEVWPAAQAEVAAELGHGDPSTIVFSSNTHDFILRLAAACPRRAGGPLRVLTSDGEFHSARRQFARWVESGEILLDTVAAEPFDDFGPRFLAAAKAGTHDLIMVSQVLFGSGRLFGEVDALASLAQEAGPWVVVDGYHAFMAVEAPLSPAAASRAFYLGGGYKYAMSGEGMAFLHCPPGFGPRPPLTGWYAEFDDLSLPPGMVGYAPDAMRFMGATFDPSALPLPRSAGDAGRGGPDDGPHFGARGGAAIAAGRLACRDRARLGRAAEPARRRTPRPLPRLPIAAGGGLVFGACGSGIHHRRARRRAADRPRALP